MDSKVFHDLINRRETANPIALNVKVSQQIGLGQPCQDFRRLLHGPAELLDEHRTGNAIPLFEFGRPVASVIYFVERCDQPLPHISV